jgi:hypothetical protein
MKTLGLFVLLACAPAWADETAARAREHYQRGTTAYEVGQYDEAIHEFAEAYKLKNDPSILFNVAQSHRLAGHRTEALRAYRMFLVKLPGSPNRREVEALIANLEQTRAANVEDPDTELSRRYFDDGSKRYEAHDYEGAVREFEKARLIRPAPGLDFNIGRAHDRLGHIEQAIASYRLYVEAKPEPRDATEVRERVRVLEGRLEQMRPAPPIAQPAAPSPAAAPAPAPKHPSLTIAGIAVGVVGVAALAGGIACGVLAQKNGDDLTHLDQTMGTFSSGKERAGKNEQLAEGVLLGVGGAALITGAVLIALDQRAKHRRLAALPSFGPGLAGLAVGGDF